MAPSNSPILLATFRLTNNVLTYVDKQTYRMNRDQAKNPALDSVLNQCINIVTSFISKFYPLNNITIRFDEIIITQDSSNPPLDIFILADYKTNDDIDDEIKNELCSLIKKFICNILHAEHEIFSSKSLPIFTPEKTNFIEEYSADIISRNNGKSISKPFICLIDGDKDFEIPIQGVFKSPAAQNIKDKSDDVFFAYSDGSKGSSMLVFLRRLDNSDKQADGPVKDFIAEKPSHTKTASIAYASDFPLVKVTTYEKENEKGKTHFYIREITQASIEDLAPFDLTLTD